MSETRQHEHRQRFIVVLGREWRDGHFYSEPPQCLKAQINNTVIISTPDASHLNDTHMLDLMALTNPGPHLFLVVQEEGKQQEEELRKWEKVFGEDISNNMRYIKDSRYKCSGSGESIKEEITKQCEDFINKHNHTTYSFGTFLNRRRQEIEDKMEIEMETDKSSSLADSFSPDSGDQQKSQQLTLVLLGESGSGKSASGNTILGEKTFASDPSSIPITTECEMQTICGTEVNVIDTPDFVDQDLPMRSKHIQKCKELCKGGQCVYLLVIQIGRFTEGEIDILERLEKALDTKVRDRAIILFTRGDDLRSESESESEIDNYVRNTNTHLQQLIKKCGGRYQVFNNTQPKQKPGRVGKFLCYMTGQKREAEKQVKGLMDKIDKLL